MKEFMVSLDITTPSLTLAELSSRLGRPCSSGSHNAGDPRPSPEPTERVWSETVWRLNSGACKADPLEKHLESLSVQLPPRILLQPGVLVEDCVVWISVGVLYDSYTVGISIGRAALDMINSYGAILDIACYPTDFAGEKPSRLT
jgi:hypothetical protein